MYNDVIATTVASNNTVTSDLPVVSVKVPHEITGKLMKLCHMLRVMPRWFVVVNGQMHYYKSEQEPKPKYIINLTGANVYNVKGFEFCINGPHFPKKKPFVLRATSVDNRKEWVTSLSAAINLANIRATAPPRKESLQSQHGTAHHLLSSTVAHGWTVTVPIDMDTTGGSQSARSNNSNGMMNICDRCSAGISTLTLPCGHYLCNNCQAADNGSPKCPRCNSLPLAAVLGNISESNENENSTALDTSG